MNARLTILLSSVVIASAQINVAGRSTISIIPRPAKVKVQEGLFTLTPRTTIFVTEDTHNIGQYLAKLLAPATGFNLDIRQYPQSKETPNSIILHSNSGKEHLGPEGYELKVLKDRVLINAHTPAGVFYACQTLRQLLPTYIESRDKVLGVAWTIPRVEIEDKPRFIWRGALLDSGRHFQSKEYIKQFIELLAYYKMNRFHWHLTDEQGWRVEIKKYPLLTEFGAWQKVEGGEKIGGFYSQEDIREIVAFAQSRYVEIVPEIEMPGHAQAALACYPQFSCTGGPFEVKRGGGAHPKPIVGHGNVVFCAGNDKTFDFLEDMLLEVLELFPSPFIHIGGDEARKNFWRGCPKCQSRIKTMKLRDEDELQSYFIKRIEKFLLSKDRQLIGWDEILEGGLAPNAIVQSWRGMEGGIAAANQGHDVIISPASHCYLNNNYTHTPIEKAYSFEPIPPELPADKVEHILGIEACMWTNTMPTTTVVDYFVFPRLCALAEVAWSPKEARNWPDFKARLKLHGGRLDKMGINFYRDPEIWPQAHLHLIMRDEVRPDRRQKSEDRAATVREQSEKQPTVGVVREPPVQDLFASDANAQDFFGRSVSISGDYAVVGAICDDDNGLQSGSAYVFNLTSGRWSEQAKLTAPDGTAHDRFGNSVSISEDYLIIGAKHDDVNGLLNFGSAHIFKRSGVNWSPQTKLTASDGRAYAYFGGSVSISGDYAIVGAYQSDVGESLSAGAAYIFKRSGAGWIQEAKLTAPDADTEDWFGYSVSISGDYAIVGAKYDDADGLENAGSAYVFKRSGAGWRQQARLGALDAAANDWFGHSVSISADYAIVSAPRDDVNAVVDAGSAYVFEREGTKWRQRAKLNASVCAAGDHFGQSVSINGRSAIVGAIYGDVGRRANCGCAYVFEREGTSWIRRARFNASDPGGNDRFGESVSISGEWVITGASRNDEKESNAGSAYVFRQKGRMFH